MIPFPGRTLQELATRLATHIAPRVEGNFGQADAGLLTGLLLTFAQDFERAVDNRMKDIAQTRQIFRETPGTAPGAEARSAFLSKEPASLQLADVNALHDEAFSLLIDLHAWAEQQDESLNLAIWRLLRDHSERNKFEIPGP